MGFTQYVQTDVRFYADIDIPDFDEELYLAGHPDLKSLVYSIGDDRDAFNDKIGTVGVMEAKVTRPAGIGGGEAELELVVDEPEAFKIATIPAIRISMHIDIYDERVFTGEVVKVTQDEEGVVTVTAQDARRDLLSYTVRLDTPGEGIPSATLIRNLLIEDGPFTEDNVFIGYEQPGVPHRSDGYFVSRDGDTFSGIEQSINVRLNVGQDHQPSLYKVIREIARAQHAYAYIDEYNNFHFHPLPKEYVWVPEYITEINAGDSSSDNDRTIVESPRMDLLGGTFGHQYVNSESTKAEAAEKSGDEKKATLLRDQNLTSVESANNVAVDHQLLNKLSLHSGEFTSVGHPVPTPYTQVVLEDLPEWTPLPEGNYTITEVTHRISADDGFLTDISVGKDLESIYKSIVDNGRSDKLAEAVNVDEYHRQQKLDRLNRIASLSTFKLFGAAFLPDSE